MVSIKSLGGLSEIGALNCYLIYWQDESGKTKGILLDCGQKVGDSDENDNGFDMIEAPNFSSIPEEVEEIVAVFLSHGHLDHIGAINEFLRFYVESSRFVDNPIPLILGSANTSRVIESKEFVELKIYDLPQLELKYAVHNPDDPKDSYMLEVEAGQVLALDDIEFEFFPMLHSIPEALGCALRVNGKKIVYTGDFKLHGLTDIETAEYVKVLNSEVIQDADLLLIDSTGVDKEGTGESDEVVVDELMDTIEAHSQGRVFITSFSSHTDRIHGLMSRLKRLSVDRNIIFHGRSMINHMQHVRGVEPLGFGSGFAPGAWKKYSYDGRYEVQDNAIIFLTGSQGEPRSALRRLLEDKEGSMEDIHIRPQDIVIFAARTIPGNEDAVSAILYELRKSGCMIYFPLDHCDQKQCPHESGTHEAGWARYATGNHIEFGKFHVSGHAYQEDLKDFISSANPRKIMPIHADFDRRAQMAELFLDYEVILPMEGEEISIQ